MTIEKHERSTKDLVKAAVSGWQYRDGWALRLNLWISRVIRVNYLINIKLIFHCFVMGHGWGKLA